MSAYYCSFSDISHILIHISQDIKLKEGYEKHGPQWKYISNNVFQGERSENHVKNRYHSAKFKKLVNDGFPKDALEYSPDKLLSTRKEERNKLLSKRKEERDKVLKENVELTRSRLPVCNPTQKGDKAENESDGSSGEGDKKDADEGERKDEESNEKDEAEDGTKKEEGVTESKRKRQAERRDNALDPVMNNPTFVHDPRDARALLEMKRGAIEQKGQPKEDEEEEPPHPAQMLVMPMPQPQYYYPYPVPQPMLIPHPAMAQMMDPHFAAQYNAAHGARGQGQELSSDGDAGDDDGAKKRGRSDSKPMARVARKKGRKNPEDQKLHDSTMRTLAIEYFSLPEFISIEAFFRSKPSHEHLLSSMRKLFTYVPRLKDLAQKRDRTDEDRVVAKEIIEKRYPSHEYGGVTIPTEYSKLQIAQAIASCHNILEQEGATEQLQKLAHAILSQRKEELSKTTDVVDI